MTADDYSEFEKQLENSMTYKGFSATIEYDETSKIFSGEVTNKRTVITFHGSSIEVAEKEFHASVDDYLEWYKEDALELEPIFLN